MDEPELPGLANADDFRRRLVRVSTVFRLVVDQVHILGQLLKGLGPKRILWGTDSMWYGSPQWQIDAFWRFQIPDELRERFGY